MDALDLFAKSEEEGWIGPDYLPKLISARKALQHPLKQIQKPVEMPFNDPFGALHSD